MGPSFGHPGAILGHLGAISGSSWVCFDQFQGYDFSFFGTTCGLLSPSWRHLETVLRLPRAILGHLGTISARLGPSWWQFGFSRRADQRRQSSFGKVHASLQREHHFVVALRPSLDIPGSSCLAHCHCDDNGTGDDDATVQETPHIIVKSIGSLYHANYRQTTA